MKDWYDLIVDFLFLTLIAILFSGCNGEMQTDCPSPQDVFSNPDLLKDATEVRTPEGCECDAPLKPALTSSWPGGCSYTYEAKCDSCVVDITWQKQ